VIGFSGQLDRLIEAIETGKPVDWEREERLQALYVAKVGQDFVAEAGTTTRAADDQLAGKPSE